MGLALLRRRDRDGLPADRPAGRWRSATVDGGPSARGGLGPNPGPRDRLGTGDRVLRGRGRPARGGRPRSRGGGARQSRTGPPGPGRAGRVVLPVWEGGPGPRDG